jgi:putative membrane protein
MKSRGMLAWSVIVLLVLGVGEGCRRKTQEGAATMGTTATGETTGAVPPAAPPAATPAPTAAVPTDAQIAQIVLVANSADSASGVMAERKATAPDVKAFGRRMVTDHSALNKKATALAKKLNLTPAPSDMSTDLQKKATDTMRDLEGKTGKDFDKAYIDSQVTYHQDLLNALDQQLIPNAQNPELKQLLQTARAGVQQHLNLAKQIQAKPTA